MIHTSWKPCPRCGTPGYWVGVVDGYKWLPNSPCITECPEKGCHWDSRGDRLEDHWVPSSSQADSEGGWDFIYY